MQVTAVKTRSRNRMKNRTLDAIVRVRSYLSNRNIAVPQFQVTENMLKRFNSNVMYKSAEKREDELSQEERDEILSLDEILNILG